MIEISESLLRKWGKMRNQAGDIVPLIVPEPWKPPALTDQQQRERDEYVKKHRLPF